MPGVFSPWLFLDKTARFFAVPARRRRVQPAIDEAPDLIPDIRAAFQAGDQFPAAPAAHKR
jgi:hypothetical protein